MSDQKTCMRPTRNLWSGCGILRPKRSSRNPNSSLTRVTRHLAILATLLGCQGKEVFAHLLPRALDAGVTPVMVKETVYQAVDYLGIGRVLPFLEQTNRVLTARGVSLPLAGQATTTMENRLKKGQLLRWRFLERACERLGKTVISTVGWQPIALATIIPAAAWISSSAR